MNLAQLRAALAALGAALTQLLNSLPGADSTAPTVSMTATASAFTEPGTVGLTVTASDNRAVVSLRVFLGDTLIGVLPPTGGTITNAITTGNGVTNQYRVEAVDAAGLKGIQELNVAVNIPPITPPDPPAPTLALNRTTGSTGDTFTATLDLLLAGDQLDWGDGLTVAAAASLSHTYSASGPYTVRVLRGGVSRASVPVAISTPVIGITYDPPITISTGGTYSGNWQSVENPDVPAVTITTAEPVTLQNSNVRGKGDLIRSRVNLGRLTVRNVGGLGLNPNINGRYQGRFLDLLALREALIENCDVEGTTGIYLNEYKGNATTETFIIRRNRTRNINGHFSNGNGGYQSGSNQFFRGQMVQLNNITNIPGCLIEWNHSTNEPRLSHIEDTINLSNCYGQAGSFITVRKNLLDGAFGLDPASVYSGGGIMLGDGEGRYQSAEDNTVLETSNYGVAVAEGNDIKILRNTILGIGRLADGTYLDADSDAGIYVRDYSPTASPRNPGSVFVDGNVVGWGTPTPSNLNARWDISIQDIGGVAQGTLGTNTLKPAGAITAAMLDAARAAYAVDLAAQSFVIGRTS